MKNMHIISSGSYSDYRVHAVCDSKKTAETIAARANADRSDYYEYMVEELPYVDDPAIQKIETLLIQVEIFDDGHPGKDTWESYTVEWPFDTLYETTECSWRWVRAPMYSGKGGRLEVRGTDHERVRKVFGDMHAMIRVDDALRARKEARG